MAQNLLLALQITAIGMGLVFGSIILFWLLMAALVRLTSAGHPHGACPDSTRRGAAFERGYPDKRSAGKPVV